MTTQVEELFQLSDQKLKRAKSLMGKIPEAASPEDQKTIEAEIEALLEDADRLSKIAEDIGTKR